ncbi:unnamed protein product [Gemmata massiliana]|uniref:Uncharacterized protein n=1 Tax=Gemmata massiliana TaxID=1210884 RepID=A0A6P2D1Z6_9BACT|nr:hypothetical protein [Gemmata massiliana]VTR93420.1 unnamed protein product [Gemmata massiliana]
MAKIGASHAAAMGRLGLAELRNAFNPSVQSVADRDGGLYGSATPQEITAARDDGPGPGSMTLAELRAAARDQARAAGPDTSKNSDRDDSGPDRSHER